MSHQHFHQHHLRTRPAFTLVELLVVIGLIGLLIALLLPALSRARDAARTTACLSNARTVGQAMAIYHGDWGVLYPERQGKSARRREVGRHP